MPQLNCDSLFFLQQLDQSEILQEPFLEVSFLGIHSFSKLFEGHTVQYSPFLKQE
jgi:hypothetical protein